MSKYHITKSGKPARCRAILRACPLGEHYETEGEAYKAIQTDMSNEYGILSNISEDKDVALKKAYKRQYDAIKKGKFKSQDDEEYERTRLANLSRQIKEINSEVDNLKDLFKDLKKSKSDIHVSVSRNTERRLSHQKAIKASSGFCANLYPEHSKTFNSAKEVTHRRILEFMNTIDKQDESILLEKDVYIGIKNDTRSGKVSLDVSKRYDNAKDARVACQRNNRATYYDLQTLENIDVNKKY